MRRRREVKVCKRNVEIRPEIKEEEKQMIMFLSRSFDDDELKD